MQEAQINKTNKKKNSHPHLEKVVPCPPASESLFPHSATKNKKEEKEVRAAPKIQRL